MTNRKETFRKWAGIHSYQVILAFLLLIGSAWGCTDGDSRPSQGLTTANLCFVSNGGNVSNTLNAGTDWFIEIPSDNPWISVSPASGSGSMTPINIMFTSTVNNNPNSRSQVIIIHIGTNKLSYIASQDGTVQQVCFD